MKGALSRFVALRRHLNRDPGPFAQHPIKRRARGRRVEASVIEVPGLRKLLWAQELQPGVVGKIIEAVLDEEIEIGSEILRRGWIGGVLEAQQDIKRRAGI